MTSSQLQKLLDNTLEGKTPTREEMITLLQFPEQSLEAGIIRSVANQITRKRMNNNATISGQIGYSTSPCPGDCAFCVFGAGHSTFPTMKMTTEEVVDRAKAMTEQGLLYNLWLMSMHDFDFEEYLNLLAAVRAVIPSNVILSSNVGDISLTQTQELKAAGLTSAYHTIRLREGIDTKLNPKTRIQTIRNIQEAGLAWGFCCEPIGPEHTPEELVDHILFGMSLNPDSFGAMRRVYLPNSPIAHRGQITFLRHAQIVAVVVFATLADPKIVSVGGHEPNLICLTSGACNACAESGANPRDTLVETSGNRGFTALESARLLYEAGFEGVMRADKTVVRLSEFFP